MTENCGNKVVPIAENFDFKSFLNAIQNLPKKRINVSIPQTTRKLKTNTMFYNLIVQFFFLIF